VSLDEPLLLEHQKKFVFNKHCLSLKGYLGNTGIFLLQFTLLKCLQQKSYSIKISIPKFTHPILHGLFEYKVM
jgi:hypothetical protein